MATAHRKFYYYKTEPDDISFLERLETVQRLDNRIRTSFTHTGRQVLFETNRRENLVCGFITLLRDDEVPSIGQRNSPIGRPMQLDPDQGVLEQSHFVFLPSKRVLVFEYNHFGPRISLLFNCLNRLFKDHVDEGADDMTYNYIPRGDALDRIRTARGIVALDISYTPAVELAGSEGDTTIHDLFRQATEIGEPQTIEIALRGTKRNRLMSAPQFLNTIIRSGRDISDYKKLRTKIENSLGAIEVVDLLQDRTVSALSVLRLDQHRQLNADNVYEQVIADIRRKFPHEIIQ